MAPLGQCAINTDLESLPARDAQGRGSSADERLAELVRLVQWIREGDDSAKEELYRLIRDGIAFLVSRHLGPQDVEDHVHDIFVIVLRAIYNGKLKDPARIVAYTRTVARRRIVSAIRESVKRRGRETLIDVRHLSAGRTPEEHAAIQEAVDLMKCVLLELRPKQREILNRCYVLGESEESICEAMKLTATQFRLLKWRSKARFAALFKARFSSVDPTRLPSQPPGSRARHRNA